MSSEIVLADPFVQDAYILLEPQVVSTLRSHAQLSADAPEAGGILIGYRRGKHLHIVEATVPAAGDAQGRFSFFRSSPSHACRARTRWSDSGGTLDYVGEWHTHPEEDPRPSCLDRVEWKKIALANQSSFLFVIPGNSDAWWFGVGVGFRLRRTEKINRA